MIWNEAIERYYNSLTQEDIPWLYIFVNNMLTFLTGQERICIALQSCFLMYLEIDIEQTIRHKHRLWT